MSKRTSTQRRSWRERALSLFLAAVMVAGLAPGVTLPASAEHWADAYMDQLVDWGIIRADQTADPDAALTRAEFMAIVNRAYGYTEKGTIPFEDVQPYDWFYDDVCIAYNAGYMLGTSETTASPDDTLTREQAVCILGRNMMMKETPGENLAFSDNHDVSDWARGTVKTAVDNYIIDGYPDNTFRPLDSVTRGQMAALITKCIGNPIQQSGAYELGGVFGNVTITSPDVTLRNTTISGDLYVSGGVGLGGIKLENVNVLGRIIVSSSGESEGGDASVIMRNVTADEMLVDNMHNKTVTVRADGITDIAKTIVRTPAYLEDNNTDDKGLMNIELDGEPGTQLTLAGRIKDVVNKTPNSLIQVAKGTVAKLTVDESATNSRVQIDRNAAVKEVNLDVATNVLGDGSIEKLNINAPGSVVSMLPDEIYIRPGLTATIAGVVMDYIAAEQGSLDPRLLTGYPAARDIAPTAFRADFAGNKKGTIYWAVSSIADGSIKEDDLIAPPSYGNRAVRNGSLASPTGGDEVSAQVTGLTVGGSYYLSAILVDEQKNRSPVKVISFSTPDNTVPAFAQGYPYMSRTTKDVSQVTVMPTKSCKLYYALLPQGAQVPTPNELKAAAVIGNLGYGVRDVTKNVEDVFTVNSQRLEELKTYVLYLWLTDADGANSSAVRSLQYSIPDETPPEFVMDVRVNGNPLANSVPMAATVNENATIYWAAVEEGTPYPLVNNNSDPLSKDNVMVDGKPIYSRYDSEYAKLCVISGMGMGVVRGQVNARANTEVTFNVTGLQPEKAYDLYYLAQDTAGNRSVQVYKLLGGLHTLDTSGPVITQSFSSIPSRDDPNSPLSSTDINLEFSENIRCNAAGDGKDFLTLYSDRTKTDADMKMFTEALKASIVLYHIDPSSTEAAEVVTWDGTDPEPEDWVVDYSQVTIESVGDGHIIVTFPGTVSNPDYPAVKLANGEQYFFQFRDITDTSTALNKLDTYNNRVDHRNAEAKHTIPVFTTVFSQVLLGSYGIDDLPVWKGPTDSGKLPSEATNTTGVIHAQADLNFRLNPQSTENTDDSNRYDILIYSDTSISYDLYYRVTDKRGVPVEVSNRFTEEEKAEFEKKLIVDHTDPAGPDESGWHYLGNQSVYAGGGRSVGHDFAGCQNSSTTAYPQLNNLSEDFYYEFVISVTQNGVLINRQDWNGEVYFDIYVEAGRNASLDYLGADTSKRVECESRGLGRTNGVVNIGLDQIEGTKYLHVPAPFPNTQAPKFQQSTPWFTHDETGNTQPKYADNGASIVGDTFAYLRVNLNAFGKVHYVVSSSTGIIPAVGGAGSNPDAIWNAVPADGYEMNDITRMPRVTYPAVLQIAEHDKYFDKGTYPQQGTVVYNTAGTVSIPISGLTADRDYYVYFVLEAQTDGDAPGERSDVYVYKFRTAKTTQPRITLDDSRQGRVSITTAQGTSSEISVSADLNWIVFPQGQGRNALSGDFTINAEGENITGYSTGDNKVDTVLKALMTKYNAEEAYGVSSGGLPENAKFGTEYNGLTVFDVFATPAQKRLVENLISATGSGTGKVNSGSAATRPTSYIDYADWVTGGDNVQPFPNEYLILVSGHNIGSSTGTDGWWSVNSFIAYDGVVLQNLKAPQLEANGGYGGFIEITRVDDITSEFGDKGILNGRIDLTFDKDVYWRYNNIDYQVQGAPTGTDNTENPPTPSYAPTGTDNNAKVGILHELQRHTGTVTASGGPQVFSIYFDGITASTTSFILLPNGYIATQAGDVTTNRIRITINKGAQPADPETGVIEYRPHFTVSFLDNDNRERGGTVPGVSVWSKGTTGNSDTSIINEPTPTAPVLGKVGKIWPDSNNSASALFYNATISLPYDQAITVQNASGATVTGNAILGGAKYTATAGVTDNQSKQVTASVTGTILTIKLTNVPYGSINISGLKIYDKATETLYTPCDLEISVVKDSSSSNQAGMTMTAPKLQVKVNGEVK